MRILLKDIRLSPLADEKDALDAAEKKLKKVFSVSSFRDVSVYRKSVDARHVNNITVVYSVCAEVNSDNVPESDLLELNASIVDDGDIQAVYGEKKTTKRPLVVGFGPAGMFCALVLAENGYRPVVIERGEDIRERNASVLLFREKRILNPESNVQFGAGGAGTFSDGKLVTRINDRMCRYVLRTFFEHGAPQSIMTNARPHVGTDNLGKIVGSVREKIISLGGEIRFNTRFEGFDKTSNEILAKTSKGDLECSSIVLAIGHSARDTYEKLAEKGLHMTPKPFSVGVRVEQKREEINSSVYGKFAGILGNAEYNMSYRRGERAVYTFCMCPGGRVIESSSEPGGVCVNGMSDYARDGDNSNAALVVSVCPSDYGTELFDGVRFQRTLEKRAFDMGGGDYGAPVQTVGDYLTGKSCSRPGLVKPTYMNGEAYRICDLNGLFPGYVNSFLKEGLVKFENRIKGYAPEYALMTAVETRTSSPLRITRGDGMFSVSDEDVFPCGEGAGYAGGITSAAVDGIRVALKIMERYKPFD